MVVRRNAGAAPQGPTADELRSERLPKLSAAADRFLHDFARLLAGHSVRFEYLDVRQQEWLLETTAPFLQAGHRLRPNFGETGATRISPDPATTDSPIVFEVAFEDRSEHEGPSGERIPRAPRRVVFRLTFDPTIEFITDIRVGEAP